MSHLRIITEGLEEYVPVDLVDLQFQSGKDGLLIDRLREVCPLIAVAVACYMYGFTPDDAGIEVTLNRELESQIKTIFDTHTDHYEMIVGDCTWTK